MSLTVCLYFTYCSTYSRYGLKGPGFEIRWGRDFLDPSRPAPRSTQPFVR